MHRGTKSRFLAEKGYKCKRTQIVFINNAHYQVSMFKFVSK